MYLPEFITLDEFTSACQEIKQEHYDIITPQHWAGVTKYGSFVVNMHGNDVLYHLTAKNIEDILNGDVSMKNLWQDKNKEIILLWLQNNA